jgi:hypothetical protein
LYEKFGFEEVPLDDCIYERADIKMEKLIAVIKRSFGIFIPDKAIFLIFLRNFIINNYFNNVNSNNAFHQTTVITTGRKKGGRKKAIFYWYS